MLAAARTSPSIRSTAQQVRTLLAQVNTTEVEARIQGGDAAIAGKRSLAVKLKHDLQTQAPELSSLVNVTYSSAKDIQAKLPADEVLVEYYYDDKKALCLRDHTRPPASGLARRRQPGQDVRRSARPLDSPKDNRHLALSQKLHRQLFQPLEATFTKQHVLIVAHGALHYLPFNALHDGREYVIDRYRLRQLPSASIMPYLRGTRATKTGTLLAFGNPDLGDKRYDSGPRPDRGTGHHQGRARCAARSCARRPPKPPSNNRVGTTPMSILPRTANSTPMHRSTPRCCWPRTKPTMARSPSASFTPCASMPTS